MMRGFNNLPGGPGGAGGQTPDCGTCIKNAWNSVPAWNRAVMIVPIILYIGSLAAPIVAYYTACIPVLVFSKFEVWRLLTGVWCHPQLIMLLFALFSYVQHGVREEKRIGTVAFFFRFWIVSTTTMALFVLVTGVTGYGVTMPAAGLWSMLFADLVIESMVQPDQPRPLCCFPVMLKAKYYPWVLIIIFSLFFGLQIDFWCGLAVGYMWHFGLFNSALQEWPRLLSGSKVQIQGMV